MARFARSELRPLQSSLLHSAELVGSRLQSRLAELKRSDPEEARRFYRSWTPTWAAKYISNASGQINKLSGFLPYFTGVRQAYDVGVGPGFLARLLMDAQGVRLFGCDVEPGGTLVFEELRKELGLEQCVQIHTVQPRQPIPIPEGCDTLIGFRASFSEGYTPADYQWLFDHCRERLTGDKRVVWLLNSASYEVEGVKDFFLRRAEFPLWDSTIPEAMHKQRVESLFCQLSLA